MMADNNQGIIGSLVNGAIRGIMGYIQLDHFAPANQVVVMPPVELPKQKPYRESSELDSTSTSTVITTQPSSSICLYVPSSEREAAELGQSGTEQRASRVTTYQADSTPPVALVITFPQTDSLKLMHLLRTPDEEQPSLHHQ